MRRRQSKEPAEPKACEGDRRRLCDSSGQWKIPSPQPKELRLPYRVSWVFSFCCCEGLPQWPSRLWVRGRTATQGRVTCEQAKTIKYRFCAVRHRRATSEASRRLAKAKLCDYANGAVGHDAVSLLFLPLAKMVRDESWTSRATLYDPSIQALAQNDVGVYVRHRSVGILRYSSCPPDE